MANTFADKIRIKPGRQAEPRKGCRRGMKFGGEGLVQEREGGVISAECGSNMSHRNIAARARMRMTPPLPHRNMRT